MMRPQRFFASATSSSSFRPRAIVLHHILSTTSFSVPVSNAYHAIKDKPTTIQSRMSTSASHKMSEKHGLVFATDSPDRQAKIHESLSPLLASSRSATTENDTEKWHPTANGQGIERTLKFRTFRQATQFMTLMFRTISEHRHHPRLVNEYNRVSLEWSTHKDRESGMAGISELDVNMAAISDEVAKEVVEKSS